MKEKVEKKRESAETAADRASFFFLNWNRTDHCWFVLNFHSAKRCLIKNKFLSLIKFAI